MDNIVNFYLLLWWEAMEAHTVNTATYNLLSMNMLRKIGYSAKFVNDKVQFFDLQGKKITRSCQAVLEGWWCPRDGLWRIPLTTRNDVRNINGHTHLSHQSSLEILGDSNAPPLEMVCNAFELKTQPKLVQYYHAAAGFPTKFTWLQAIRNGHYSMLSVTPYGTYGRYVPALCGCRYGFRSVFGRILQYPYRAT